MAHKFCLFKPRLFHEGQYFTCLWSLNLMMQHGTLVLTPGEAHEALVGRLHLLTCHAALGTSCCATQQTELEVQTLTPHIRLHVSFPPKQIYLPQALLSRGQFGKGESKWSTHGTTACRNVGRSSVHGFGINGRRDAHEAERHMHTALHRKLARNPARDGTTGEHTELMQPELERGERLGCARGTIAQERSFSVCFSFWCTILEFLK